MDVTYVSETRVRFVSTADLLKEILYRQRQNAGAFTGEDARLAQELAEKLNAPAILSYP